jgi:two-component system OmpR family response regulator
MKALVVEDDPAVAQLNERLLRQEGLDVDVARSVREGSDLVRENSYDLITLDLNLPDGSGLEVLAVIRSSDRLVPVLVVSGTGEEDATVNALDAGADDYILKPYRISVLAARVRAILRRSTSNTPRTSSCGNVVLDTVTRDATIGDSKMDLTPKEFTLLEYLTRHAGCEVTRKELLEKVWRFNFDPGTNMVDANVSRVRAKLMKLGATCRLESVRGVGYVMRPENGLPATA